MFFTLLLLPLMSKYSPLHNNPIHPQYMFFLWDDRPTVTPT